MEIILSELKIENFKGIPKLELDFGQITNILGANGTGKTTIADSINWLLFGKDSLDRANFEIKTLDHNNEVIHHLITNVEGAFKIDGREVILSRITKEKWTKRRGALEKILEGTVSEFYVNEIPYKKKDYEVYIANLVNTEVFKLITNPGYFNTLHWKKQREILTEIAGEFDNNRVFAERSDLRILEQLLGDGVENLITRTKSQINKLKKDREGIFYRIDELKKQIAKTGNLESWETRRKFSLKRYEDIEEELQQVSNEQYKLNLENKLLNLEHEGRNKLYRAKLEAEKPLREAKQRQEDIECALQRIEHQQNQLEIAVNDNKDLEIRYTKEIMQLEATRENLVREFKSCQALECKIKDNDYKCPMCDQDLPEKDMENKIVELKRIFEEGKNRELSAIQQKGKDNNARRDRLVETRSKLESQIKLDSDTIRELIDQQSRLNIEWDKVKANVKDLSQNEISEYFGMTEDLEKIKELKNKIASIDYSQENVIKDKLKEAKLELDMIDGEINTIKNMRDLKDRIIELEAEEMSINQQIVELEGREFQAQEFVRTKVRLMENDINKHFSNIKFKMFEQLVNGGLQETCEATVDGVPYSNVNTAGKLNAGLDIINTLSKHYNVTAPIIIDNRESVNTIIDTKSQIINLRVGKNENLEVSYGK